MEHSSGAEGSAVVGERRAPLARDRARQRKEAILNELVVKALGEDTWPDFASRVEQHNGVWGGCWCMGFHAEGAGRTKTVEQNRCPLIPR